MKRYYLTFAGYTVHPSDTGFSTHKEARKAQAEIIKDDLAKARRKWKRAFLLRHGDSFAIHASRDSRSPMWSAGNIISA